MSNLQSYTFFTFIFLCLLSCSKDDNATIELSDQNEILSFSFTSKKNENIVANINGSINKLERTIILDVSYPVNLTSIKPSIVISKGATSIPSLDSKQDFTEMRTYKIIAENKSETNYKVFVNTGLSDINSLKALYKANPQNLLNWGMSAETMAGWEGVTETNGRVTKLVLENKNINILPAEIGNLSELKIFYLIGNSINSLPKQVENFNKLTHFSLEKNKLQQFPEVILKLKNLTYLSVASNNIPTLPNAIGVLNKLKRLDVDNTNLMELPIEIGMLTELEYFYLYQNSITTLPKEVGNLIKLKHFFADKNNLISLPSEIGNWVEMNEMFLDYNKFSSIPPEIGNLIKLSRLGISENPNLTTLPNSLCELERNGTIIFKDSQVSCN